LRELVENLSREKENIWSENLALQMELDNMRNQNLE
jgi:hypothetical protein